MTHLWPLLYDYCILLRAVPRFDLRDVVFQICRYVVCALKRRTNIIAQNWIDTVGSESRHEVARSAQVAKLWVAFVDQNSLAGSLFVGGNKYMVIAGDAGAVIRGKKQQSGIVIKKTNTAMVVGTFDEGAQPGDCNIVVENLGDYLVGQGI